MIPYTFDAVECFESCFRIVGWFRMVVGLKADSLARGRLACFRMKETQSFQISTCTYDPI